ncbi:MAG: hypothetical protein AMXMBFR52_14960 [Burkholderiales bacterium]
MNAFKTIGAARGRALRARQAVDMWTMRLRRTGSARGQRAALPTVAAFAHIPTALNHKEEKRRAPGKRHPSLG